MIRLDTWCQEDCTLGRLSYKDFKCFTLELPWLMNKNGVSCIPEGVYGIERYNSPKHGEVLLLKDTGGRTFIEIHAGNFTRQIQGCILVGDSIKYIDGDNIADVGNSKNTLKKLLEVFEGDRILITRTSRHLPE